MSNGRCRPSAFGIYRRLTAKVDTCPLAIARRGLREIPRRPLLDGGQRHRIDARRAAVLLDASPCFPQDVTPVRCGPATHENVGPVAAWPHSRVDVAIGALCRGTLVRRGGWIRSSRSCPRACLLRRLITPGTLGPAALFVASLVATMVPSDSRCAMLAFAFGLYEPPCRDWAAETGLSCSAPLLHACCAPYPAGPARRLRYSPRKFRLRRDMIGSALRVVNLSRLQASLDVAARGLAPRSVTLAPHGLLTPRLGHALSSRARGLLPGAPVLTEAGLAPAGEAQQVMAPSPTDADRQSITSRRTKAPCYLLVRRAPSGVS